ncbi:glycosyltransferase [Acinetobacter sp. YWS30-1]|uniref:glycosyltransferase family 2 protein n=1 Tax=Acinetobacter sp. YWS30-1 TaxID=2996862 RepID=UPI002B25F8C5|nr:glycosyltransferase [Acinetobacter sp. YWS30-1]WPC34789.1 glycosyltransferase [Acinetobacter sp. YWS30-1]
MKVSIGIPFYNAEKYLEYAIKSVLYQSHQEWELILIDDGSTDNSLEIAKSFNDSRIRVISDGQNKKLSARLNQIVKEAKYEYIVRMDADDLMDSTRIEKQIKFLNDNPDIDLVSASVCSISNDNKIYGARIYEHNDLNAFDILAGNIGIVHPSLMVRKSWYERNHYQDNIVAEDYELWCRSYFNDDLKCYRMSEPLYYYREDSSITYAKLKRAYKDQLRIVSNYKSKLNSFSFYHLFIKLYLKLLIIFVLNTFNQLDFLFKFRISRELSKRELDIINTNINLLYSKEFS